MYLSSRDAPPAFKLFWPPITNAHSGRNFSADLAARMAASSLIGGSNFDQAVAPFPKWTTDIGLRPPTETSDIFLSESREFSDSEFSSALDTIDSKDAVVAALLLGRGWDSALPSFDFQKWLSHWLDRGEYQVVTQSIAQYNDAFGSSADAAELSQQLLMEIRSGRRLLHTGTAAFLFLHAACCLATAKSPDSRQLFDLAIEYMTAPWDKFFVTLRALTAEVKRLDGSQLAARGREIDSLISTLDALYGKPAADLALSVRRNLQALLAMKSGDISDAATLIDEARQHALRGLLLDTGYPWSVASRYHVQVCLNWTTIRLQKDPSSIEALAELTRLEEFCRSYDPRSSSEVLSHHAIPLMKTGRYAEAAALLRNALPLLEGAFATAKRNAALALLISAEHELGNKEASIAAASRIVHPNQFMQQFIGQ